MREEGEVPAGAEADVKQGDALNLPFPDGEFDRVVASEVLEHIPDDEAAIAELVRVLRPGGTHRGDRAAMAAREDLLGALRRLPRGRGRPRPHLPRRRAARPSSSEAGLRFLGAHHAHALHSPYWWVKCAVGVEQRQEPAGRRRYHRLLVWDIVKKPLATRLAEKVLNPLDRQEHGALPREARAADR